MHTDERVRIIKIECILVNSGRKGIFVEVLSSFFRFVDRLLACPLVGRGSDGLTACHTLRETEETLNRG